jgi:hypothetical protein
LISTVCADGSDIAVDYESTRFAKRRASPSWDEPHVPEPPAAQIAELCHLVMDWTSH